MNDVWNLDPFYLGFDDPAFEADMGKLKAAVEEIGAFADRLPTLAPIDGLTQGIALEETFTRLINKLAGFASLRQAANTRDGEAGSRMGQIMGLYAGVAAPFAAFKDWAGKLPNLMELVEGDENLKDYTCNNIRNQYSCGSELGFVN